MQEDSVLGDGPLLERIQSPSHCMPTWPLLVVCAWRRKGLWSSPLLRPAIPPQGSTLKTSSKPNYCPNPYFQIPSHGRLGPQPVKHSVHSTSQHKSQIEKNQEEKMVCFCLVLLWNIQKLLELKGALVKWTIISHETPPWNILINSYFDVISNSQKIAKNNIRTPIYTLPRFTHV